MRLFLTPFLFSVSVLFPLHLLGVEITDEEVAGFIAIQGSRSATFGQFVNGGAFSPERKTELSAFLESEGLLNQKVPDFEVRPGSSTIQVALPFEKSIQFSIQSKPRPAIKMGSRVIELENKSVQQVFNSVLNELRESAGGRASGVSSFRFLVPQAEAFLPFAIMPAAVVVGGFLAGEQIAFCKKGELASPVGLKKCYLKSDTEMLKLLYGNHGFRGFTCEAEKLKSVDHRLGEILVKQNAQGELSEFVIPVQKHMDRSKKAPCSVHVVHGLVEKTQGWCAENDAIKKAPEVATKIPFSRMISCCKSKECQTQFAKHIEEIEKKRIESARRFFNSPWPTPGPASKSVQ